MRNEIPGNAQLAIDTSSYTRDRARAFGAWNSYAWSTPKSAAFFAAIIVLALLLAQILELVIGRQPG
jgi:hypothetical protein